MISSQAGEGRAARTATALLTPSTWKEVAMPAGEFTRLCECGCGAPVRRRFAVGHGRRQSVAERLHKKLARSKRAGCLEFTGARNAGGYGVIGVGSGAALAHRVAWEAANGPIPEGMHVCHHCDNPPCCEPSHLFLGTDADNRRDMARKGRGTSGPLPYGVSKANGRDDRWFARAKRNGRDIYLGVYGTIAEAAAVAAEFKQHNIKIVEV